MELEVYGGVRSDLPMQGLSLFPTQQLPKYPCPVK